MPIGPFDPRRRAVLCLLFTGVLVSAACATAFAGPPNPAGTGGWSAPDMSVKSGAVRTLPAGYFGINYDYGGAMDMAVGSNAGTMMANLAPGTIRWPAGTDANYFDWHSGQASNDPIPNFSFTLEDLAAVSKLTGSTAPVFNLNVTPLDGGTIQDRIEDDLDLLTQAAANGLPVKYIELGNELYLCADSNNAVWYPSGTEYGSAVVDFTTAIHTQFPNALVAADVSDTTCDARATNWNSDMVRAIQAAAKGKPAGYPDAFTVHEHPEYAVPLTTSNVGDFLALPASTVKQTQDTITTMESLTSQYLPSTVKSYWLTEYSLSLQGPGTPPPQNMYAGSLFNADLALQLAQNIPDSSLVDFWTAFGPALSYAYIYFAGADSSTARLTADGQAMAWVGQAGNDATQMTALTFNGFPDLPGGIPALVGASFSETGPDASSTVREVVINLGNTAVTAKVGGPIPTGAPYQQVSGNPTAPGTVPQPTTGTTSGPLSLPAYSITLVG